MLTQLAKHCTLLSLVRSSGYYGQQSEPSRFANIDKNTVNCLT